MGKQLQMHEARDKLSARSMAIRLDSGNTFVVGHKDSKRWPWTEKFGTLTQALEGGLAMATRREVIAKTLGN